MSVINQMLRDLDARAASEQERNGLPPKLRTLPPATRSRGQDWRMLALGMGIGAVVAGLLFWLLQPEPVAPSAPQSAPPVVPRVVMPPPPVVPTAPTSAPSAAAAMDAGEMKLSTLISQAKLPEPPAPPATPPAPPQANPTTAAKPAEKPVDKPIEKPAAKPPAEAKPVAPLKPAVAKPEPAAAEAQIDKRNKGGQGREMAEAEYRKGMQAVKRGDYAAALPLLQHALELDPGAAKARQALLSVLVSGKQWAEAQQVAQSGLAIDPAQTGWAAILARLQFEQGDTPGALETLNRHAAHAGNDADYQGLFAYLLQKQQRPAEAVLRFQAALALRPQEARWWFGLGLALEGAGRGAEARDAFAKAREAGNLPADMASIVDQKLR